MVDGLGPFTINERAQQSLVLPVASLEPHIKISCKENGLWLRNFSEVCLQSFPERGSILLKI